MEPYFSLTWRVIKWIRNMEKTLFFQVIWLKCTGFTRNSLQLNMLTTRLGNQLDLSSRCKLGCIMLYLMDIYNKTNQTLNLTSYTHSTTWQLLLNKTLPTQVRSSSLINHTKTIQNLQRDLSKRTVFWLKDLEDWRASFASTKVSFYKENHITPEEWWSMIKWS